MSSGAQYDERSVLLRFFGEKRDGILVEVGASDGLENSHTEFLIRERGWSAILIEPHPRFFEKLSDRYADNPNVITVHAGVLTTPGTHRLYLNRQISRFLESPVGFDHSGHADVECFTLAHLCEQFDVPRQFDFLTVDAECKDIDVLQSFDWLRWEPELVCVEHTYPQELHAFFADKPYSRYHRNIGNTFFAKVNKTAHITDL
ncbi:MAG: FkbM family methyltransferase [Hydrogenophaga sp.]|uniref:FkbM family methyltransferase n=1 Tax=Hydrogenophaga sp. TaxID=1904254 RepID=UPI0026061713|nr:FkbM family methyltransferase [Hydrogenophaga sp.]MCV0439744.1 FkbM family methyltransferase [Hydrogenophaga sp.]